MQQAGRFAVVGAASTVLGGGIILWSRMQLGLGLIAANVLGYGAGLILSFLGHRLWVFRSHNGPVRSALRALPVFAALFLTAFVGNLAVTAGLLRLGLGYPPAQIAGMCIYSLTMFLGGRSLVFAPQAAQSESSKP